MKQLFADMAGGIAIIAVAAVIGVAYNAVRADSVPLIQRVQAVSTVSHDRPATATDGDEGGTISTPPASAPLPEDAVSIDDVKAAVDAGTAVIIDARAQSVFAEGHIPTAINIPYDHLPEYYDMLLETVPLDARVICYCWGPSCDFSDQLATELRIIGYLDVVVFTGGWEHWQAAGYPVEKEKG
jgi:rhodanese-related sulfurtransferase